MSNKEEKTLGWQAVCLDDECPWPGRQFYTKRIEGQQHYTEQEANRRALAEADTHIKTSREHIVRVIEIYTEPGHHLDFVRPVKGKGGTAPFDKRRRRYLESRLKDIL